MRALPIIPLIPTAPRPVPPAAVLRHPAPAGLARAGAIEIPCGVALLHLAPEAPGGPGDTRAQSGAALRAITQRLARLGLGLADVVRLQVALAPDPAHDGAADPAGFEAAWREAQGNAAPPAPTLISILQVTGLGAPDRLVAIEATAARAAAAVTPRAGH